MAEVTSQLLNYNKNSQRGTASRAIRMKSPATNGNTFNANQQMIFRLPSNMNNAYLDGEHLYLKMEIENNDATAIALEGSCGAYGLISRVECLVSGSNVFTIDNYGELISIFGDIECSVAFKENRGKLLYGMAGLKHTGTSIAAGAKLSVCLPLHATIFQSIQHYIPLSSRDNIELRFTLNTAKKAVVSADELNTDSQLVINSPELVYYVIELNSEANNFVQQSVGGLYSLNAKDYRHTQLSMAATDTSAVHNLGFAVSSLESIFIIFTPTSSQNGGAFTSNSNRFYPNLSEINLLLNGEKIPQRVIKGSATDMAEFTAELALRERTLDTFFNESSINNDGTNSGKYVLGSAATGESDALTGNFVVVIDLEAMKGSNPNDLFSGYSTIGQVLQAEIKSSAPIGTACNVHYFANYTLNMSLDMNGSGTWNVAV